MRSTDQSGACSRGPMTVADKIHNVMKCSMDKWCKYTTKCLINSVPSHRIFLAHLWCESTNYIYIIISNRLKSDIVVTTTVSPVAKTI